MTAELTHDHFVQSQDLFSSSIPYSCRVRVRAGRLPRRPDLLIIIFMYLPYFHGLVLCLSVTWQIMSFLKMDDLFRCSLVCRAWHEVVQDPLLWGRVDFSILGDK